MKHKNAEVIKAYIEGIECEFFGLITNQWLTIDKLETFDVFDQVRIKPEPKPDVVRYCCIFSLNVEEINLTSCPCDFDNLKLTFDGETGILKLAEVIKNV